MVDGISKFQIADIFKNINDQDIDNDYVGAVPSNKMNEFIDHDSMIAQKKGKYPFLIANTDR